MKITKLVFALSISMLSVCTCVGEEKDAEKKGVKTQTVTVSMTGVTRSGYQVYVREAFSKLDGVVCEDAEKDIKVIGGSKEGTQLVVLRATDPSKITRQAATKAMGPLKKKFLVVSVVKGDPRLPQTFAISMTGIT